MDEAAQHGAAGAALASDNAVAAQVAAAPPPASGPQAHRLAVDLQAMGFAASDCATALSLHADSGLGDDVALERATMFLLSPELDQRHLLEAVESLEGMGFEPRSRVIAALQACKLDQGRAMDRLLQQDE